MVAGYAASHFRKASPGLLLGVVLAYQLVGMLGEWATKGDFWLADWYSGHAASDIRELAIH